MNRRFEDTNASTFAQQSTTPWLHSSRTLFDNRAVTSQIRYRDPVNNAWRKIWFLKVTSPRRGSNENSTCPFVSGDNRYFSKTLEHLVIEAGTIVELDMVAVLVGKGNEYVLSDIPEQGNQS